MRRSRFVAFLCAWPSPSARGQRRQRRADSRIEGDQIADAPLYEAAKKEGALLLYSTYNARGMSQIVTKFQADTGLAVDVIRLPSAEMFDRATAEFPRIA